MTTSKRLNTPARNKKIITDACLYGNVVTIIGYNSKKVLQQYDVLPVDFEDAKVNPYFKGYQVDKSAKTVIRDVNKKNKLSRFYFNRCSGIINAYNLNGLISMKNNKCVFDPALIKARFKYHKNKKNKSRYIWLVC